MAYYLGIDGGGTKTRCVLGDEAGVLASAVSGGSNIVRLGEARARESLHAVIRQVCAIGRVSLPQIRAICVGASGAGRPEIADRIRAIVAELDPHPSASRIEVTADTVIALQAAFGSGAGVIAIAGTGSIILGRDAAGRTARAGGWGFAVSDEGSGQWIGRQAVSLVLRARDQNEETALAARILDAWKLANIDALILQANSTPPPEFPRLFPVVLRAAEEGDRIARELLARAGSELAGLAEIVLRRISPAPPRVPVALTGSVFRQSADVRRVFYNHLVSSFPGIDVRDDFVDPVLGALALARAAGQAKTS
ncbi:MAG: BadF/BadG/BcrA/BcrD ATPase family protein [Terriglobales bacterium]|jgi:N-acetylglucosamine kinase-like BadF-type ATPase